MLVYALQISWSLGFFVVLAVGTVSLVVYGISVLIQRPQSADEVLAQWWARKGAVPTVLGLILGVFTVWVLLSWTADHLSSNVTKGQLRQLGLAMHNYHGDFDRFPAAAIYSKDGKPLLSWRVTLLPFLGHDSLFKQFNLQEPWDSDHNKRLLPLMPDIYRSHHYPCVDTSFTFYRVFTGPGTVFDGNNRMTLEMLHLGDGPHNTLLIVEAGEPVPWTKPDELPFTPQGPLPPLGGPRGSVFHFVAGDGSSYMAPKNIATEKLRAWITATGGERELPIDLGR